MYQKEINNKEIKNTIGWGLKRKYQVTITVYLVLSVKTPALRNTIATCLYRQMCFLTATGCLNVF